MSSSKLFSGDFYLFFDARPSKFEICNSKFSFECLGLGLDFKDSDISKTLGLSLDIQGPVSSGLGLKNCSYPSLGLSLHNQEFPSLRLRRTSESLSLGLES